MGAAAAVSAALLVLSFTSVYNRTAVVPVTPATPALGGWVFVSVHCNGTCPPWVRLDRLDGVADTSPFVRVVDEAVSFTWAPRFPFWMQPAWGPTPMSFGGSVDNKPIRFVCAGYSDQYNGTRLTPNSSVAVLDFDVGFQTQAFPLSATSLRPGTVRLTLENNPEEPRFTHARFDRFVLSRAGNATHAAEFEASFVYHQESERGAITLAFQQPGIYYYGATPSRLGRAGVCTAGGEYDARPSTTPLALVVRGPDGALNASLPPGFNGTVHEVEPLASPHQFCILRQNVTVFPGVKLFIPLCRPDPAQEIPAQPRFVTVVASSWLAVLPQSNATSQHPAVVDATRTLPDGRVQTTFECSRWSTYNNNVGFYFDFPAARTRCATPPCTAPLQLLIHDGAPEEVGDAAAWQSLLLRLVPAPNATAGPGMTTSVTWSDASLLLDGAAASPHGPHSWLQTYRRLGLNTAPHVSVNADLTPSSRRPPFGQRDVYPGNRTGPDWEGLVFGPELSGFGGVFHEMLHTPPNASVLLAMGVPPSRLKAELAQWAAAIAFHNATQTVDIGYDGAWFRHDVAEYCNASQVIQPEWLFADCEGWGEGWEAWLGNAVQSANAQARRLPGEAPADLAYRMVVEMLSAWTSCLHPGTTLGFYGSSFVDRQFAAAGIAMQPSTYGPIHSRLNYARWLRNFRLRMAEAATGAGASDATAASGAGRPLLPWITSCTYGQMTPREVLDGALYTFAGGATGFSFFIDSCLSDGAHLLSLATAVTLAAPHEALFLQGRPMPEDAVAARTNLLAWAGMRGPGSSGTAQAGAWLVLTPLNPRSPVEIWLDIDPHTVQACQLESGRPVAAQPGPQGTGFRLSLVGGGCSTVLYLGDAAAGTAAACAGGPPDPAMWWPDLAHDADL